MRAFYLLGILIVFWFSESIFPQNPSLANEVLTSSNHGSFHDYQEAREKSSMESQVMKAPKDSGKDTTITLFMTGDVMLGRGIDQIFSHPSDPVLYESYVKDARDYVALAVMKNGSITYPVDYEYVWGDALVELEKLAPDLRIINLETSITTSSNYWQGKGINYRMHPTNAQTLTAAKIDYCTLANNHVLDWGYEGFIETLTVLESLKISYSGGGRTRGEAELPAIFEVAGKGRVIIFSYGHQSSGIPSSWAATEKKPGLNLLPDYSEKSLQRIAKQVTLLHRPGDIIVFSIHWGGNWGYEIPERHKKFAHALIDQAGVDIIHGQSSHHVMGIEVYNDKLILYGCGDFLNDYEGIRGHEQYRGDLALMYLPTIDPVNGNLQQLTLLPTQTRNLRINQANRKDAEWLLSILNREGEEFGTSVRQNIDSSFSLVW